ncbi:hypothetical protein Tco_0218376 [Tanacetum coccineum]
MVGFMCLEELTVASESCMLKDQMLVYIDRGAFIEELKKLKCSVDAMQSAAFLNNIQRRDVKRAMRLLIMVKEAQL